MKHRIRIIAVVITLAVFAGAYLLYDHFAGKTEFAQGEEPSKAAPAGQGRGAGGRAPIPVNVYIADYMVLTPGTKAIGNLVANEEVDITSEVSGKVIAIKFEEGAFVKRGELLVKINDDDLQAQLKRALFQRNLLKDKLDRNRILLEKDAISREAFDQIETDYNMVDADMQLLEVRIAKTEIRAPFDGKLGFRYISLGSYIQPTTVITRLVDYTKIKLEFAVPERYVTTDLQGSQITFATQNDSRVRTATITAVDSKANITTRDINLRAIYDNRDMSVLPGMYFEAMFGQRSGRMIALPTEAVIAEAGGQKVWVVKDGKAVSTPVKVATRGESMIEIEQGVAQGDSVVVTGLMQVREGSKLLINN